MYKSLPNFTSYTNTRPAFLASMHGSTYTHPTLPRYVLTLSS